MHTVIEYTGDGQIRSAARCNSDEMVAGKCAALTKAGSAHVVLWHCDLTSGINLLCWDVEQGRLTRREQTLAELRAPVLLALKQHHAVAAQADILLADGHVVQGDGRAQGVVMNFALRIRAGETSPHGGFWHCKDNCDIAFSDEDVLALDAKFTARAAEMQARTWALAAEIRALADPQAISGFDLAARWDALAPTGA